ncbi:hypothetical protein [Sorangium cellulosum]|nr:hypothetical protein [Sorangium cellulosum]
MQNTVMASIVEHIAQAGLKPEIDALAGPELLEQIGNVLPRYDAMVRDKLQKEAVATSNLADDRQDRLNKTADDPMG